MEGRQHKRIIKNISPLLSTGEATPGVCTQFLAPQYTKNIGLLLQVQ